MVLESRNGLMGPSTKDTGKIIELMAKVNSPISMETYTRATGSTIRLMELAYTPMSMELATKEPGKMTFSTAMVKKVGLMAASTRENT